MIDKPGRAVVSSCVCILPSGPSYVRTLTPRGTMVDSLYPTRLSPLSEPYSEALNPVSHKNSRGWMVGYRPRIFASFPRYHYRNRPFRITRMSLDACIPGLHRSLFSRQRSSTEGYADSKNEPEPQRSSDRANRLQGRLLTGGRTILLHLDVVELFAGLDGF